MRSPVPRLSLRQKLFLAMAVLTGVAVLVSLIGLNSLRTLNTRLHAVVGVAAEKIKLAARMKQDLLAITRAEKNLMLADRPEEWDVYAEFIDQTQAKMQEASKKLWALADETGRQQLDRFAAVWDQWLALNIQVEAFVRDNAPTRARELSAGRGRTLADKGEALLTAIIDKNDVDMAAERLSSYENYASTQTLILLLNGGGLITGVGLALFVLQNITRNLEVLSRYVRTVETTQDLSRPVPVMTDDEIGQLGRSFDAMRHSLNESREQQRRFEQRLEQLVEERTAALRAAQAQLVKQERLATLGQLAGSVAHEIRNPLGVIRNASYFLREVQAADADEDIRESFEEIERGLANSDRIISELLDYTRDPKTEHIVFALEEAVDQAIADVDIPPAVQLERLRDQSQLCVQGDPGQIERLIGNLLRNAVQAMPNGGTLSVRCLRQHGKACIEVADTGGGIAADDLEKIFEPLYTKKAKGIGLGLAMSRRYAELNQGRLEVESELGQGATFRVVLPLMTH